MEPLDYDNALTLIAETCEYTNMPMGTVTGPAGVRAVLEPFFAPTIANEFKVLREAVAEPVAAAAPAEVRDVLAELRVMKGLIEDRFGALAFMEKLQRQPRQALLAQKLLDAGFSPGLIRKLVDEENPGKPMSDSAIAGELNRRGIAVARRTVAKYREALNIPASSDRCRLA